MPEEVSQLLAMRRQGMPFKEIANAMNKTERAVGQKFQILVPNNSPNKKKYKVEPQMTEGMRIKLLSSVAKRKHHFWMEVAKDVGEGATASQCEEVYTGEIARRG